MASAHSLRFVTHAQGTKKHECCARLRPWSWWPQSLFVWIRRHDKWSQMDCCKYETLFGSFFDRSLQGKAEKQAIKKGASRHDFVINECASGLILCCIWLLSLLLYNFYIEICCMSCFKQALNNKKWVKDKMCSCRVAALSISHALMWLFSLLSPR
jgi:hypothetical protein